MMPHKIGGNNSMRVLAALFLIVALAVQFVLSYRQARLQVQERIDLKTQIAHENILFELYDAYEAYDHPKKECGTPKATE